MGSEVTICVQGPLEPYLFVTFLPCYVANTVMFFKRKMSRKSADFLRLEIEGFVTLSFYKQGRGTGSVHEQCMIGDLLSEVHKS